MASNICRWLFVCCVPLIFLSGCGGSKKVINPYDQREKREAVAAEQRQAQKSEDLGAPVDVSSAMPVSRQPGAEDLLLPTLTLINERIYAYEQKYKTWQGFQRSKGALIHDQEMVNKISDCRVQLQNILVAYNALHQRLIGKESLDAAQLLAGESLAGINEQDINYLESNCNQLLTKTDGDPVVTEAGMKNLFEEELRIQKAYDIGDYDQIIAVYEQLPLSVGQVPPYNTTYQYGQALLKSRREPEARKIFSGLLEDIRQQGHAQWEMRLLELMGDLDFGMELYDAAQQRYEEIAASYEQLRRKNERADKQLEALKVRDQQGDAVKAYASLLKNQLGYNPERDGYGVVFQADRYVQQYPYSPVSSNVDQLLTVAREQADYWLESVLKRADNLAAKRKFQEALLLIERVPRGVLPPEKQALLQKKTEDLSTSESISIETHRLVQEQELQEGWNKAMTYLEAKEYDQAIEEFAKLLETAYADKARNRIDEAARLAALDDRKRAADLFLRAKRTDDMESRIKLLYASRQLLQDILVKYPQSDLTSRIKENLNRVEEEIRGIDPALLTAPDLLGGESPPVESMIVNPLQPVQ